MKHLLKYVALAAFPIIAATSCSDDLSEVGTSVRPATDGFTLKTASYEIPLQTAYRDSVYVRTGYPLLGVVSDPDMGELNAGYLAQFYANRETSMNVYGTSDSLIFDLLRTSVIRQLETEEPGQWDPQGFYKSRFDSLVDNKIDSMTIRIFYNAYYGDSLAPMQVSIYGLNPDVDFEELPESEFYSNNDFSTLYNSSNLLGRKAFTAANREVSSSERNASDYMNYLEIKLDDSYKDKFLRLAAHAAIARDTKNPNRTQHTDIFANQKDLRANWLSGVCVKPTFGDGAIVKVYYTAIYLFYSSLHRYAPDGTLLRNAQDDGDSTYVTNHVKYIAVTPDVIQLSGMDYKDDKKEERLQCSDSAFISSPEGYYATIDLPVGQIISTMMNDPIRQDSSYFLNAANFYLKAYKPQGIVLGSTPAPTLLMVTTDSINSYFQEGKMPNNVTSCVAYYSSDSVPSDNYVIPNEGIYYYTFGNISSVILGLARKYGWDKQMATSADWEQVLRAKGAISAGQNVDDFKVRMALLPVVVNTNSASSVQSISNYILPTAIRLRKGEKAQQMQTVYTMEGSKR